MALDQPILITSDYRKTGRARAIPYAYFSGGGWYLPPEPDPESARWALRLFPKLQALNPDLVARARLSTVDFEPIDYSLPRWGAGRPLSEDPWPRVAAEVARRGWEFHEFQRADVDFAIDRFNRGRGAYLGWDMGLGKTLGACMAIEGWPANFVLVTCLNENKQDPWVEHLEAFCPWLQIVVVGNTKKARDAAVDQAAEHEMNGTPFAMICHYQALSIIDGPSKRGWKKLGQWDLLVSDEAHLHKNVRTQFTAATHRIPAAGRLFLSGSVMSGDAERLFVPFRTLRRKVYRSQWRDWNDPFLDVIEDDYARVCVGPSMERLPEFRKALGDMLVVRPAKRFLQLPEPVVVEHKLGMYPEQRAAYRSLTDEFFADMPDGSTVSADDGAPLRTALRRVTGGVPASGGVGLVSTKLDKAVELVESAADSQLVVFTWHVNLTVELQRRLIERNVPTGRIAGDVRKKDRPDIIDLFKREGYRVLVATIKTLSAGVNLQNASHVIMVEESDDPIDNDQAKARVFRQGQTAHGSVHNLRCEHTVDDLEVWPNAITKSELRRLVLGA